MELIHAPHHMTEWSARARSQGLSIGFVPTMGALHEGHLFLVRQAKQKHGKVACSIFVNPLQFNDPADFENYPVRLQEDEALLREAGCDIAFLPNKEELFADFTPREYSLGGLDSYWEGPLRPGHFQGVVNVVERLFHFVRPDAAYFGEKDRQQLVILKRVAADYRWPVRIHGCPTVRADDGVALSSRNLRLSPNERAQAATIPAALNLLKERAETSPLREAVADARAFLSRDSGISIEYLGVGRCDTLEPMLDWENQTCGIALVAVRLGPVRLIDNVTIERRMAASSEGQ